MSFWAFCYGVKWLMPVLLVLLLVAVGLDVVGASVVHRRTAVDDYASCMSLEKSMSDGSGSINSLKDRKMLGMKPEFDRAVATSVDIALNEPAYLHCRIIRQGEHEVAWTRAGDNNLLTVGETSFTSDPRFQVSLKSSVSDWVLIIRRTERRDTGCYLCEVNSEPDSIIYPVFLNVIERPLLDDWSSTTADDGFGETLLQNDAKLEVTNQGATISLDCTVTMKSDALVHDFVVWTKNGSILDTQDGKKYIASKTKRDSSTVVHTLKIKEATAQDAGLYACKADNAPVMQQLVQINTLDDDLATKEKLSNITSWSGQNDAPFSPSDGSNVNGVNGANSPMHYHGLAICLMALLSLIWR